MEIANEELRSQNMDHHGLAASVCQDLGIADKIDVCLAKKDPRRIVSAGTAVVAMILNGLGFTNRRLYLTPQFFESKPVQQLLGKEITPAQLDDHALGKALDEISAYGSSKLFGEVAFDIAIEHKLLSPLAHLDSTSFSVEGEYEVDSPEHIVKLTHGHSKDHRPDLKQVMMSLVVTGESAVPLWMEPQNGNSSDKKSFHETIKNVRRFQKELKACPEFKWIADSALYSKEGLLSQNDYLWISRVPENIKEAKELVELPNLEIEWVERDSHYKTASFESTYGGVKQRWLLIYSSQSYAREEKTFERNITKKEEKLEKLLWHLKNEVFDCEADAIKSLNKIRKQFPYHEIVYEIENMSKHKKSGRPKKGDHGEVVGVRLCANFNKNEEAIEIALRRKGRFILATNDLSTESFSDESMLSEYKSQQKVERGFKFLKDPWFMVDSFFLKLPSRIEALMMVMTLCLMVYNVGQHRVRSALKDAGETLPNQINKPIQNPTLRWIFQMMEGVSIVTFFESSIVEPVRKVITGLNELRMKIIKLFGPSAQKIYGVT